MKEQEVQKHFLALQYLPGDYCYVEIPKLDIASNYQPTCLAEIDSFTMNFSEEEIFNSIKRANIVGNKYFDGKLVIADNQKHNPLKVITKDFYDEFNIEDYILNNMYDKNIMNNLVNKFASIIKDDEISLSFKNAYNNLDVYKMQEILFNQDYLLQRKLIVYLIEKEQIKKKEKYNELVRDKAA